MLRDFFRKITGQPTSDDIAGFHDAAQSADLEHVKNFIKKFGAKHVDAECAYHNGSALVGAAMRGQIGVMEFLLQQGADINFSNFLGQNALMQSKDEKTAAFLIKSGAALEAKDDRGWTPLVFAILLQHEPDMAETLLRHGARTDVAFRCDLKSDDGCFESGGHTPLMVAAYNGHAELVNLLLRYGADHRAVNDDGQTALDMARDMKIFLHARGFGTYDTQNCGTEGHIACRKILEEWPQKLKEQQVQNAARAAHDGIASFKPLPLIKLGKRTP